MVKQKTQVYEAIDKNIKALQTSSISTERKVVLDELVHYLQTQIKADERKINLNFICTHNSRRSHLSQIWAQTMAIYFGFDRIQCYSGGTEATAVYPSVISTLRQQGFKVNSLSTGENPVYAIKMADNEPALIGFSKVYDDAFNPHSDFAAIMTCDAANEACPVVFGATAKIPITYQDPKRYDNTDLEQEKYLACSTLIATEFYYVFSQLKVK